MPIMPLFVRGYKDGYAVYQHLKDIGEENNWQILTNSNGEGNTAKALKPHVKYLEMFEKKLCAWIMTLREEKQFKNRTGNSYCFSQSKPSTIEWN